MHISRSHPQELIGGSGRGRGICILTSSPQPSPQLTLSQAMPQTLKTSTGHCHPPNKKTAGRKTSSRPLSPSEGNPHQAAQGPANAGRHSRWQPLRLPGGSFSQTGEPWRGGGLLLTSRNPSRPPAATSSGPAGAGRGRRPSGG